MSSAALKLFTTVAGVYSSWAMFALGAFMSNAALWVPLAKWVFPYSVDAEEGAMKGVGVAAGAVNNLALLAVFMLQHSVMLRSWFKNAFGRIVPPAYVAPTYTFVSGVVLHLLMAAWVPMGPYLWKVETATPLFFGVHLLRLVAFLGCIRAVRSLPNEDIQLTQAKKGNLDAPPKKELRLAFPYNVVRHPAMSLLMVATWSTPQLSMGHLLLSIVFQLYIVLAVLFLEEAELVKEFGDQYRRYQKRVPAFIPFRGVITKLD